MMLQNTTTKLLVAACGLVLLGTLGSCKKFSPEACLEVSNFNPKIGEEVTFVNCSKRYKLHELSTGDGAVYDTDGEVLSAHKYERSGTYTATLTVFDKKERKYDEISTSINVVAPALNEIIGDWDLNRIETYTYHGPNESRDESLRTLEATQNVGNLRYSFQADTFFIFLMPDTIQIYNNDWVYDYYPEWPDLELHFGFGNGYNLNVIGITEEEMICRTTDENRLWHHYYFDRVQ